MIVRRIQNDELYHHGVKGQKWGVRNGPPYPLDETKSTGRQLKRIKKLNKKAAKIKENIEYSQKRSLIAGKKAYDETTSEEQKDAISRVVARHIMEYAKMQDLMEKSITDKSIKKSQAYKDAAAYINYIGSESLTSLYYTGNAWVEKYDYSVGIKRQANKKVNNIHRQEAANELITKLEILKWIPNVA